MGDESDLLRPVTERDCLAARKKSPAIAVALCFLLGPLGLAYLDWIMALVYTAGVVAAYLAIGKLAILLGWTATLVLAMENAEKFNLAEEKRVLECRLSVLARQAEGGD